MQNTKYLDTENVAQKSHETSPRGEQSRTYRLNTFKPVLSVRATCYNIRTLSFFPHIVFVNLIYSSQ